MMSPEGRENFLHKWRQVIGSIQKTNDLDVHMALITAPTYATELKNKYYTRTKTPHQIIREHIDFFGFMQKNVNAMDILIEDAKVTLQTWGSMDPTFMLVNSKLTFQMTMTPEKTNFITQGYDGVKRLRAGPFLDSYRGLNIIHTRQYSLETGAPPRDLLRRRVRVAEYSRIPWSDDFLGQQLVIHNGGQAAGGHAHMRHNHNDAAFGNHILIDLYDESKDTFFTTTWQELLLHAALDEEDRCSMLDSLQGVQILTVRSSLVAIARADDNDLDGDGHNLREFPIRRANKFARAVAGAQNGEALLLQDQPIPLYDTLSEAQKVEQTTFYRNSGLYCVRAPFYSTIANNMEDYEELVGNLGLANAGELNILCAPGPVRQPVAENIRKAIFTQTMLGYGNPAANRRQYTYEGFNTGIAIRPNVHVGRMAFTFHKPTVPRFVHIAAQIFSQVVVTKALSNRLLQVLHKPNSTYGAAAAGPNQWTPADTAMHTEALKVLGIEYNDRTWRDKSFFGVDRCLLVYMAAAVLHPSKEWRGKFAIMLEEKKIPMEKIGQSLVDFIKFFITSLPMTKQRSAMPGSRTTLTGNLFNCMEQGINLQRVFDKFCETQETVNEFMPPVYLGPLIPYNDCQQAFAQQYAAGNPAPGFLENTLLPTFFTRGPNDNQIDIDRDVQNSDFTGPTPDNPNHARHPGLRGYVFPGSLQEGLRQEDFLAITKSINVHDCLVAFVQIMLKRFFQHDSYKFVETRINENGTHMSEEWNQGAMGRQPGGGGVQDHSRTALTSNDYPVHKCGQHEDNHQNFKWEIVVVRPNIEHNMLGAILGRYVCIDVCVCV
jgi:hypothetical protein